MKVKTVEMSVLMDRYKHNKVCLEYVCFYFSWFIEFREKFHILQWPWVKGGGDFKKSLNELKNCDIFKIILKSNY